MKQIIDISDELFSIFKKHGIMAFDYLNEYDKDNLARIIANGTPYNPTGDSISREAINSEIEKRYCSKHCVVPSEEPYCPDNCPARFLKNIVKECPTVPQVTVFAENADEKAVADMKAELQNVIGAIPKGEWIIDGHHRRCEKCGEYFCIADSEGNEIPSNFCPNCGADMRGETD